MSETKRQNKICLMVLTMILAGLVLSLVQLQPMTSIPITYTTGSPFTGYTVTQYASTIGIGSAFHRMTFTANGLDWYWYVKQSTVAIVYQTSNDSGETWSGETQPVFGDSQIACTNNGNNMAVFFDGTYVHLAYFEYQSLPSNLNYVMGTPNADGTITWVTNSPQLVQAGTGVNDVFTHLGVAIVVDPSGRPWISANHHVHPNSKQTVYKSIENNGTWVSEGGFPFELSSTVDTYTYGTLCPVDSGDVVCVWQTQTDMHIWSKTWYASNSSWGSPTQVSANTVGGGLYSMVNKGDTGSGDAAFLAFSDGSAIKWRKWDVTSDGWSGSDATVTAGLGATSPSLTNIDGLNLACIWANGVTLYYNTMPIDTEVWSEDLTLIDEPYTTLPLLLTASYTAYSGRVGVAWMDSGSPNYFRWGYYEIQYSILGSISLNTPTTGAILNSKTVDFVFTPVWTSTNSFIQYAALYVDGNLRDLKAYPSLINNTQNTITWTLPNATSNSWYVRLHNTTDYIQSSTYTLSFESQLSSVVATSPATGSSVSNKTVSFVFTPTWNLGNDYIRNATLYVDSQVVLNQSALINGSSSIILVTLSDYASYTWYVRFCNSTSYIQSATLSLTVTVPPSPPTFIDPTTIDTTFFMRSDTHTVSGILGYKLTEVESALMVNDTRTLTGNYSVSYGFRAYALDGSGNAYEVTSGVSGIVTFPSNYEGEGLVEGTYACPDYPYLIDAVRVNVYQRFGSGSWSLRAVFMSKAELMIKFPSSDWTIYYYIARNVTGTDTMSTFSWGISPTLSAIYLEYGTVSPWEMMTYWLLKRQFFNFMVTPWTFYLGDAFYGILLMFFCITTYNRYQSVGAVIGILWLFGGAGGVLSLMIPAVGMKLAWIVLVLALSLTLYKVFR